MMNAEVLDLLPPEEAALVARAASVLEARLRYRAGEGVPVASPKAAAELLRMRLAGRARETFAMLWLDSRHRLIACDELFHGTIDGAQVSAREVVRAALARNAAAAIAGHNHPSGCPEPSAADAAVTRKLRDALALVEVRLLDHIVVGAEGAVSLAERGLL